MIPLAANKIVTNVASEIMPSSGCSVRDRPKNSRNMPRAMPRILAKMPSSPNPPYLF